MRIMLVVERGESSTGKTFRPGTDDEVGVDITVVADVMACLTKTHYDAIIFHSQEHGFTQAFADSATIKAMLSD